jgi:hypothetical protein
MTWLLLLQQRVLNVETLHYESILSGLNQSWEKIRNEQHNDFGIRCLQFKICSRPDEPTIAPKRRSGALTNQRFIPPLGESSRSAANASRDPSCFGKIIFGNQQITLLCDPW